MSNTSKVEQALELAAYRCDMDTFRNFMDRVEKALETGGDIESLEKEINEAVNHTRSRVFNIHKVANDATTNLQNYASA